MIRNFFLVSALLLTINAFSQHKYYNTNSKVNATVIGLNSSRTTPIANSSYVPTHRTCGFMAADSALKINNPQLESFDNFEQWLAPKVQAYKAMINNTANKFTPAVYTIPVVVHVIHAGEAVGTGTNISLAQINSQITVLNEDFRRNNADTMNAPASFRAVAADTEVEFCMALVDPSGNTLAEPGVDRVNGNTAGFGGGPYTQGTINGTIKPATSWNPSNYMNIWVLQLGGGLLGYAQFPSSSGLAGMQANGGAANTDGVVIGYNYFGNTGNVSAPFDLGRTTTHEVGHWIGLRHIWGDGPCGTDDFCLDTPESNASNYGCLTTHVSCGTTDMVQNYMDYSDDACMSIFTADQKARMVTVMTNSPRRASLNSSTVCNALAPPVCSFTPTATTVQEGNSITFTDATTGGPTAWSWTFTSGTPATSTAQNPAVTYSTAGTFGVTLTASNSAGSCSSTSVVTITLPPAPVCNVTVSSSTVSQGSTVFFTDLSTGTPTAWNWTINGGVPNSSITQNPSSVFNTAGNYTISMTATNSGGSCSVTTSVSVTPPAAPVCSFLSSPITPSIGGAVNFTDQTTGAPTSWSWNFAGGTPGTSTVQNPSVTYSATGTFGVTLTATNAQGSCTSTSTITVANVASCDTLGFPFVGTATTYTTNGGYLYGWNNYNDSAKAEFYANPTPLNVVTGMLVAIGAINDGGNGATVDFHLWDATGAGTSPGNVIATTTVSLTTLNTSVVNSGTVQINFIPNITVTGDFFAGMTMNGFGNNDTIGISSNTLGDPAVNGGWEQWSDGTWHDIPGSYTVGNSDAFFWPLVTQYPTQSNPTVNVNAICKNATLAFDASSSTNVFSGYQWTFNSGTPNSSTALAPNVSYSVAGTYTAYLATYGQCGSIDIDSIPNITITSPATLSTTVTDENCGQANGTATVSETGGTAPFTYMWSTSGTTQTVTGVSASTVIVTVVDINSCNVTASATVVNIAGPTANVTSTNENCGQGNGTATAIPLGGISPYTYNWSSGGVTQTENNLGAGSYSVTITDSKSCSVTSLVSITSIAGPSASTTIVDASCAANNGSATAIPVGGTMPYTYNWSSGGTVQTENNLGAGSYIVTVSDANLCVVTTTANISNLGGPSITVTVINATCANSNGSASVSVSGGASPISYVWSSGGSTANEINLNAGSYSVSVSDASGCIATGSAVVGTQSLATLITTVTDENCGQANGTATVITTGGISPFTYLWSSGGTAQTETNLNASTITVTVTDANSCTITTSATVANIAGPIVSVSTTDATCGNTNGTATVIPSSGISPYIYSWSSGGTVQTETNLSASTIIVTVTDANSCTVTASATVANIAGASVSVSVSDATCGNTNGTATVIPSGGISPYTYSWSSGGAGQTENNLGSGTYSVTVLDANLCSVTTSATINNLSAPSISVTAIDATCGNNNGTVLVAVSGGVSPISYLWSSGGITSSEINLGIGTYSVSVTDASGCTSLGNATIAMQNAPILSTVVTNATCGSNNGSIVVSTTGGTAPFTYAWTSGGTTATELGLGVGNQTVTVTDANLCNVTASAIVNNDSPSVSVTSTNETCGQANGSAIATASLGVIPYTYMWSTGGTAATENNISGGNHSVTVTDANSCIVITNFTVGITTGPSTTVSATNSTCGSTNGSATVSVSGGTPNYSYVWSSGANSATASNLLAGNYTVTVSDANNCTSTQVVTVTDIAGATASVVTSNASCGGNNGTATAIVTGGTTPYSYLWSNGGNAVTIVSLSAASYTVTVTDGNACNAIAAGNVSNIGAPTASITTTNETCSNSNGTATVNVTGGNTPYTYNWSNGNTGTTITNLSATTYTVTITDASACNSIVSGAVIDLAAPSITATTTNATCGASNGTATAIVTGGTAPFSYLWSSGGTTINETGLAASGYTVSVTDANVCMVTTTVIINNTTPGVAVSVTNASCGNNNGQATVLTSGGTPPYSYSWSSGGNGMTEINLLAGNYTVTVTDAASCTSANSFIINGTSVPSSISITTTDESCGNVNGVASATVTGGNTPYSYLWSNSSVNAIISALAANTYTLTVTDINNCTITSSATVNNLSGANIIATGVNADCNLSNGSATAIASGGTPSYTYSWSSGGVTSTETGLIPGTYSITVTDANFCSTTQNVVIGNNVGPSVSISITPSTCGNFNGTANAIASGGTAPYTYMWSNGDVTVASSGLTAGSYSVTISDNNTCSAIATNIVTDLAGPSIIVNPTDATCGNSNGAAIVSTTGGASPFSYSWSTGGNLVSENGLAAGNYFVTVSDNNGCSAATSFAINTSSLVVISSFTNETCSNANGSAAVTVTGGATPYNYSWSSGGNTAAEINLVSGSYDITITDQNGCLTFDNFNLNNSPSPIVNVTTTNATCGAANAIATSAVVSGTSPFTYNWSSGGNTSIESNLSAGLFMLTVTDANSCVATANFNVNNTSPTISTSSSSASCGNSNGSAIVSASGGTIPYTYLWSNGGTANVESNIPSGIYTVTVSDASSCTAFAVVTVGDTPLPTLITTTTDATCGGNNGSASVTATGGASPYSYIWSSGSTNTSALNLSAGNYTVIVTDNLGCSTIESIVVNNPGNLAATTSVTDATCGQTNGAASLSVTGGTAPYIISWSGGAGNSTTATGLNGGVYTATIFDANTCVTVKNITIADIAGPSVSVTSVNELCGNSDGIATVTSTGGTTPVSYVWSNGNTNATAVGLSAGNYSVTVSDNGGCQSSQTVNITNTAGPVSSVNTTDEICGQANGTAVAAVTGGSPAYTFIWSNGSSSSILTGVSSGQLTVTVTDNNGCQSISSGLVNGISGPIIAVSGSGETCTNSNGIGTVVVNGGTAPYVYLWSSGGISAMESGLSAGNYSVTVIDNNGCSEMAAITLTNAQPSVSITSTNASCSINNGVAQANVSGGVAPYSYSWSSGKTTSAILNLGVGTYTLTLLDGNGCSVVESVVVDSIPKPIISVSVVNAKCNEANGSISTNVVGGISPYTYSWTELNGTTASQNNLVGGTYSIQVTDSANCVSSAVVVLTNNPSPRVTITSTDASCEIDNGMVTLAVEGGTGSINYEWSTGDVTETVSGLNEGTYYLSVTDANNCTTIDTAIVIRNAGICLEIPSGFSPNGDGVNDVWNIYGTEFYSNINVEIFNRWGTLLFQSNGYVEPWGGKNANGAEVPSAVYYYIVTLGKEVKTGTVTIKR